MDLPILPGALSRDVVSLPWSSRSRLSAGRVRKATSRASSASGLKRRPHGHEHTHRKRSARRRRSGASHGRARAPGSPRRLMPTTRRDARTATAKPRPARSTASTGSRRQVDVAARGAGVTTGTAVGSGSGDRAYGRAPRAHSVPRTIHDVSGHLADFHARSLRAASGRLPARPPGARLGRDAKARRRFARARSLIAVGTGLRMWGSTRPPHRSQRALLAHWAPRLGSGVEARGGPGVGDLRPR